MHYTLIAYKPDCGDYYNHGLRSSEHDVVPKASEEEVIRGAITYLSQNLAYWESEWVIHIVKGNGSMWTSDVDHISYNDDSSTEETDLERIRDEIKSRVDKIVSDRNIEVARKNDEELRQRRLREEAQNRSEYERLKALYEPNK